MGTKKVILENVLWHFNWRWKAHLKGQYTQQQFSRDFRKQIRDWIKEHEQK